MPVKQVLTKAKFPVKVWADDVESSALDQLTNTANLPFVFKHVAAMPDVHMGKGATVGSVIATKGAVCPAAVGVDIGCGMMAVKTDLNSNIVCDNLEKIRQSIEGSIPLGHHSNSRIVKSVENWKGWKHWNATSVGSQRANKLDKKDKGLYQKAKSQLGSLGGGNHFIEVCLDTEECVWVMLHSGSRNVGKSLAERHVKTAKRLMKQMYIALVDPDLAYLAEGTEEFKLYMADLNWCQDYAYQNRVEMMDRVMDDLSRLVNNKERIERLMEVNCHHNYIAREHHYGENVLVTRKGAVRARKDDLGIIPGSMGTKSYIVRGLGEPLAFHSCSHGAGRRMSRGEAKRTFTVDDLRNQTQGVECRKDFGVIDEIPGAYKSIDEVMKNQSDLVEIVAQLKQVVCVKG
jgi:tRNA-splicing ligase RtcB